MQNKVICDTGIISKYLSGNNQIAKKIDEIGVENIIITPIIRIELARWLSLYTGIDKKKRAIFKKIIRNFPIYQINENISKIAVDISDKNDSLDAPDILIGATAVYHKIPIYTLNKKHFKQMKGIELY